MNPARSPGSSRDRPGATPAYVDAIFHVTFYVISIPVVITVITTVTALAVHCWSQATTTNTDTTVATSTIAAATTAAATTAAAAVATEA
jgi:hypothetical protein